VLLIVLLFVSLVVFIFAARFVPSRSRFELYNISQPKRKEKKDP